MNAVPAYALDNAIEANEPLNFLETAETEVTQAPVSLRPTSKIAENITIITAADISRINAHTLSDVLQTVPGIQVEYIRTPGSVTYFSIQGAMNTTVLVLIDGVRQNDFAQNIIQPGMIPVQNIERIEIIKGTASSSWGSALGGVINIITKSPNPDQPVSGMVSSSVGSMFTADSRAELNGTLDRFGYYLTAGHLRSDGLLPNTATETNNLYGKFSYLLPGKGTATFGLSYLTMRGGMDEGETAAWGFVHDNAEYRRGYSFLKFSQPLGYKLTLDLDGYVTNRDDHAKYGGRNDQGAITFSSDLNDWDINRGANSRLTWGDGQQNLVTGIEYAHTHARSTDLLSGNPPTADLTWERWSLYGNGAYSIGPVTILPGIRYDHTGLAGNNSSYMLGATWQLTEKTTLRGYVGNGYSPTSTSHLNGLQKVTTVQGGVESGAVPYIWLKATYFNNLLRNSQTIGVVPLISNQRREGFEIEARTTPFFGFALNSGYTYLYAKSTDTGARLQTDSSQTVPPHTVKLALNYDNSTRGLRGALTGNYVWWNASTDSMAQGDGMIWNLHLNWKVCPKSALSPELFFSGHNLFNGVQTTDTELFTNAGRWFEGGIRVNF